MGICTRCVVELFPFMSWRYIAPRTAVFLRISDRRVGVARGIAVVSESDITPCEFADIEGTIDES